MHRPAVISHKARLYVDASTSILDSHSQKQSGIYHPATSCHFERRYVIPLLYPFGMFCRRFLGPALDVVPGRTCP
jgi:hypothetical protein